MKHSVRNFWIFAVTTFLAVVVGRLLMREYFADLVSIWQFPDWLHSSLLQPLANRIGKWPLASLIVYPLAVLLILLLERVFPAKPDQKNSQRWPCP